MFKLFLVDDESIICQGLRTTINWERYDIQVVGEAYDGKEALERINKLPKVDIVLTDVVMPVMDGIQLSMELTKRTDPPKVIMISGYEEFEYAKQALKAGVKDYLLKPVNIDELLQTLGRLMEGGVDEKIAVEDCVRPKQQGIRKENDWAITRAVDYIKQFYTDDLKVMDVAEYVHLSPNYFSSRFKQCMGVNFNQFLNQCRIEMAKVLLNNTADRVKDISEQVGYREYKYFVYVFKRLVDVTPTQYRKH